MEICYNAYLCGRRIMANMSAFQANDESSILSARTKDEPFETSELSGVFCIDVLKVAFNHKFDNNYVYGEK
jgi:hypothetical protein